MTLALALLAALVRQDDPATLILKEAMAKEGDPAALERALASIDEDLRQRPRAPLAHYARGWVLSRLGRATVAVAAYDEAFRLDPKLADAAYNAGVVLSRVGRRAEAAARFDAASAADPKHVDALYNAGQSYYDQKDFKNALARWSKARVLAPDDFNTVKKVLQAQNALGDAAGAAETRRALFELHKTSKDPKIRALKSVVFDQFDVGKAHVFAYEAFDIGGNLAYVYQFQVTLQNRPLGSVNLETSAVLREQGTPYIVGVDIGPRHITTTTGFKTLPSLAELRPLVLELIEKHFADAVKGP